MLSDTFEERLKWIDPDHYQRSDKMLVVREKHLEGEAEVHCMVSNDSLGMNLGEKNALQYLINRQVADFVIFEFLESRKIKIHILECKRKIKKKEWEKIKKQFEGALINAMALVGILGLPEIVDVIFYTFFRVDQLDPKKNPSPVNLRGWNREGVFDWFENKISILSISKAVHKKIELDSDGRRTIVL